MANKSYLDKSGLAYFWGKIKAKLSDKQDTLVSGTNIKTINSTSLLGSGNINIPVITVDSSMSSSSTNPVQNKVINTALDGKANASSLASYLPLSGGTMTGDIVLKDLNGATFTTDRTHYYYPAANSVGNLPCVRDSYHDRLAFSTIITNEITTDGTTWNSMNDTSALNNLFVQKQNQQILILPTDSLARRFVITGTQYSQIEWFEFFVTYANSGSAQQFVFKIETSPDSSTWTSRYETTFNSIMAGAYCHTGIISGGVDTYYRFTFTKTGSITNREMRLAFLRGFTRRRGNQGLGIEQEIPYDWDSNRNIYPLSNNSMTLGTSSRKWSNVYATTFTGALSGNASTATRATQDGSGNTITTTYAKKSEVPSAGTITSGSTGYATGGDVYNAIGDVETILQTLNSGSGV